MQTLSSTPAIVKIGTWQLIGFSLVMNSNADWTFGTMFVDSSSVQTQRVFNPAIDFTTSALLQVGGQSASDSFIGDVSGLKIMTPGAGIVSNSDQPSCSPANSLELGTQSFSLTCSAGRSMSMQDGQCSNSCSGYINTDTPQNLCGNAFLFRFTSWDIIVPCPDDCDKCDRNGCIESKIKGILWIIISQFLHFRWCDCSNRMW